MMTTYFYNLLLEANDTEAFEKNFTSFNENVTYPLLKLNTRDRYVVKKAFKENPRLLSDAILQAYKSGEGQAFVKANEGLELLRSVISKAEEKVVYINIGATWCPGTRHEIPYQLELADTLKSEPLRIVNFYIDNGSDGINPFHPMIETYHLTEEQRAGLDPILHTGRGIPFYILIDKDGIIVDFGEHLRPSVPKTKDILETYLDE
jgi:thiol-disulfide isomerase/thioredoxin